MTETDIQPTDRTTDRDEEDYSLDPRTVDAILEAVDAGRHAAEIDSAAGTSARGRHR
jgi:hypothetical protein